MSFVEKIIGPDEKLVGVAYIHWIYALKGVMWLIGLTALGALFDYAVNVYIAPVIGTAFLPLGTAGFWVFTAIGLILSFFYFAMWIATEVGLTTKRIIFKKGLFFVDVKELDIEEIKAADIDNGLLGVQLKYGSIRFDARFVENITLPAIVKPYRFMQALNDMRSKLKSDSAHSVLQDTESARQTDTDDQLHDEKYKGAPELSDSIENAERITDKAKHDAPMVFDDSPKTRKQRMKRRFMNTFKRKAKTKS